MNCCFRAFNKTFLQYLSGFIIWIAIVLIVLAVSIKTASASEEVYVLFGPYIDLGKGEYEVEFRLKLSGERIDDTVAKIDVVTRASQKIYALRYIRGDDFGSIGVPRDFVISFSTSGDSGFEFRVAAINGARLSVDRISFSGEIFQTDVKSSENILRKESMRRSIGVIESFLGKEFRYGERGLILDVAASEGKELVFIPGSDETPAQAKVEQEKSVSKQSLISVVLLMLALTMIVLVVSVKMPDLLSGRPKYLALVYILGWIAISIFNGNVIITGFEIRAEYLLILYVVCKVALRLDSRVSIAIALALLAGCPVLLIMDKNVLAETTAVFAYYFLVIGVIFQVFEYQKEVGDNQACG